jgi:hypothetical protein
MQFKCTFLHYLVFFSTNVLMVVIIQHIFYCWSYRNFTERKQWKDIKTSEEDPTRNNSGGVHQGSLARVAPQGVRKGWCVGPTQHHRHRLSAEDVDFTSRLLLFISQFNLRSSYREAHFFLSPSSCRPPSYTMPDPRWATAAILPPYL